MAVLSTERTDIRVGSMVFGSIARATKSSTSLAGKLLLEKNEPAASAAAERIRQHFMFAGWALSRERSDGSCGSRGNRGNIFEVERATVNEF